jgi:hypothetical protein
MIPVIGIMVGFYIFTRMLHLALDQKLSGPTRFFAVLTMLIAVCGMLYLIFAPALSDIFSK